MTFFHKLSPEKEEVPSRRNEAECQEVSKGQRHSLKGLVIGRIYEVPK